MGATLEPRFGTLWLERISSWPKAACSRFRKASPFLCIDLKETAFPGCAVGWAWSLPVLLFLLEIHLWETSGEETAMTSILQTGKQAQPPVS